MAVTGPQRRAARRDRVLAGAGALAGAGIVGWLLAGSDRELGTAFAACPLWALCSATAAHGLTLVLRSEAWRLALNAVEGQAVPRSHLHAANAGAFLAGCAQSHAAMPVRVALLRRLARDRAPGAAQIVLADAPIFLIEVCLAATLLICAAGAAPALPWWVGPVVLTGGLAALASLRTLHVRLAHRSLTAGLAVISDPRRRAALTALVAIITGLALFRVWILLRAFGLEAGPAEVALVFFSLGVIGLLPLGMGTGPTATVATAGTAAGALIPAAAAGLAISASTLLAVLAYALVCYPRAAVTAARRRSASATTASASCCSNRAAS